MPKFMRLVNIISRSQALYRSDRLKEETLLPWHYNYVMPICFHPGLSQEQLARHVCMDKSNVTRHLAKLEEQGYVERRPSETDKRVTLVHPPAGGNAAQDPGDQPGMVGLHSGRLLRSGERTAGGDPADHCPPGQRICQFKG